MVQSVFKFGDFTRPGRAWVRPGSACWETPPEAASLLGQAGALLVLLADRQGRKRMPTLPGTKVGCTS